MKLRRIGYLVGMLIAVLFANEASALPVFARQTGMACSACHFQHFPLLNAFGRAFKASGFTIVGTQALVEGEGLSIPATINAAFLTSMGYEKTNAVKTPGNTNLSPGEASTGAVFVGATGGEASLFVGGRGSDFMGYLSEITLGDGAAAADSLKTPILFDVNGTRMGVVPFSTNGQGASYGFEVLNTGANAIHSITNTVGFNNQYINAISAQQWIGTGAAATGASFVATNEYGFINITKFDQIGPGNDTFASLGSTYARIVGTFDLGGWDAAVGFQSWSGNSVFGVAQGVFVNQDSRATAIDGQLQGELSGMPTGFYFSYATAPASSNTVNNTFNSSLTDSKNSLNFSAELGIVPEKATVAFALRRANNNDATNTTPGKFSDNALYLTATYKLAQNLLGRLSYVHNSGNYWNLPSTTGSGNTLAQDFGTNSTTANIYALF